MATPSADEKEAYLIGNPPNCHIATPTHTDITRSFPSAPPPNAILLPTRTTPLLLDPAKTALVIIDMQNFFLSAALGRKRGPGHAAASALQEIAIPAARRAGIRVVWLNWGLTEAEVAAAPPSMKRAFGDVGRRVEYSAIDAAGAKTGAERGLGYGKDKKLYRGLGQDLGLVEVDGVEVEAGRMLMRDQWNTALHPPLASVFDEGSRLAQKPDVWLHKNRLSGMWGAGGMCEDFLEEQSIRTLLFAGVNTDQCVAGTLTDSYSKGYDCILLADGCGTTSGPFAQECVELNAGKSWGWLSDCASLAKASKS